MNLENFNHSIDPINALDVAKGFDDKWRDFGNSPSDELIDLWHTICRTFNKVYLHNHCNTNKTYFNIPAPTGSGKTQILKHYTSELVRQRSDIGVLIVTNYISDAEEVAKDINNCSNSPYAAETYHSSSRISRDELYKFNDIQVVVITHENYIRNHNVDSTNHNIYQQLTTFNNSDREIVIIDEEVNLINHISITKRLISTVESSLTMLASRVTDNTLNFELQLARYLLDNYDLLFYKEHKHKRLIGSKVLLLRKISYKLEITVAEVEQLFELQHLKDSIRSGELEAINAGLDTRSIDIYAQNLKYLLDDDLYEYNGKNGYEYRTSTLEYPDKSVAVLNATANPNSIGLPNIQTITLPSVKTYEQVRLFKVKANKTYVGKGAFDKLDRVNREDGIDYMPSVLCDFAKFGNDNKQSALFTHKQTKVRLTQSRNISDVSLDHFGNLTGVNKYKDCNDIIIYGIHYKPSFIYIDALTHMIGSDALLDVNKGKLLEIEYADISADIVQAINRGRCRGIVDSKAPKMDVQLVMPNNKKLTSQILSFIAKSMPSVQILNSPFTLDLTPQAKPIGRDDEFISAIDNGKDDIVLKDIKDSLYISKKVWERMLKHLTKQEHNNSFLAANVKLKGYKAIKKGKSWHLTKE